MPQSFLWDRVHYLLTSHDRTPEPALTPTPTPHRTPTRRSISSHSSVCTSASLSDDRLRRARRDRRLAQTPPLSPDTHPRDQIAILLERLQEADDRADAAEKVADDESRARRVAEEQRDVALLRLSEVPGHFAEATEEVDEECARLNDEVERLKEQIKAMQESFRKERDTYVRQLAERTRDFADIEKEFADARQTYITAAQNFEEERLVFSKRLAQVNAAHEMTPGNNDHEQQTDRLADHCGKLEQENATPHSDKAHADISNPSADDHVPEDGCNLTNVAGDSDFSQSQLSFAGQEREAMDHFSSSSLSCDTGGSMNVTHRMLELEASLENEVRVSESLRRQVEILKETIKEKESEAAKLRSEMSSIHSKMRRMATVSMPKGAEELLHEDEEDRKKLAQIRAKSREAERKNGGVVEKSKMGGNVVKRGSYSNRRRMKMSENKNARAYPIR